MSDIYAPVPEECGPSDDDCAVAIWRRGRKVLVLHLNCYGTVEANVGLRNPPGGMTYTETFEDAFKWYASDDETLPPPLGRKKADGTRFPV